MQSFFTWMSSVALCCAVSATAMAATVKVGVVLTYSGGGAEFGQQVDRGMSLYLKHQAEAFGGHEIEIIKRDSKRPGGDIAKTAVQELITRDKVDLLTGFIFSPNAIASASLATQGCGSADDELGRSIRCIIHADVEIKQCS